MKEQKKKEKKEIVVIDKGIDAIGHGATACCQVAFGPFR